MFGQAIKYSRPIQRLFFCIGLIFSAQLFAAGSPQSITAQDLFAQSPVGYVARIKLNNPPEVEQLLKRAEAYYIANDFSNDLPPIVFVLHGPEVEIFDRNKYDKHKAIVDLAARLQAFNVIDVRVCETRMRLSGQKEESLFPFVGTVPFGPAEIERLINEEEYVYF